MRRSCRVRTCAQVLQACLLQHDLVLCEHILDELSHHLARKARLPQAEVNELIDLLRTRAEMVTPIRPPVTCDDPDDLPVLGAALAGRVDVLVSGDGHPHQLVKIENAPIISPGRFRELSR